MTESNLFLRNIQYGDNLALARVIRKTMEEFKVNKPGTVYYESTTDHLFELFQSTAGSEYFVVELNGEVAGGAGIFPTDQLSPGVCELVKMYIQPAARGMGIGKELIRRCLQSARELNYHGVYVESMFELKQAVRLYEHFGFQYLNEQMGNSQHLTDIWMMKKL